MYASFPKVDLQSQYRRNGNTEEGGKLLILNCKISEKGRRRKIRFSDNACKAFPNILINNETFDLECSFNFDLLPFAPSANASISQSCCSKRKHKSKQKITNKNIKIFSKKRTQRKEKNIAKVQPR